MRRRTFIASYTVLAGLVCQTAWADRARSVPRIGFLRLGRPPKSNVDAFEDGLRALGYRLGDDLLIDYRVADDPADLPMLASDLARTGVDVIIASSTPAALAAEHATSVIPIIFVAVAYPVEAGLVASLPRPGGNATGLTVTPADLAGKRLQLLSEILPALTCVAVVANTTSPATPPQIDAAETAAKTRGLKIALLNVADIDGFDRAYAAAKGCGALLQLDAPLFTTHRDRLVELAARNGLPTMYGLREFPVAGGLISYGADFREHYRRAAAFVDKILKGAKPADLPVEQAATFKLVINLKTAQALGLTIPAAVLAQADEVIE